MVDDDGRRGRRARRVTGGATAGGTLAPAVRSCCQDQPTEPPAGTVRRPDAVGRVGPRRLRAVGPPQAPVGVGRGGVHARVAGGHAVDPADEPRLPGGVAEGDPDRGEDRRGALAAAVRRAGRDGAAAELAVVDHDAHPARRSCRWPRRPPGPTRGRTPVRPPAARATDQATPGRAARRATSSQRAGSSSRSGGRRTGPPHGSGPRLPVGQPDPDHEAALGVGPAAGDGLARHDEADLLARGEPAHQDAGARSVGGQRRRPSASPCPARGCRRRPGRRRRAGRRTPSWSPSAA